MVSLNHFQDTLPFGHRALTLARAHMLVKFMSVTGSAVLIIFFPCYIFLTGKLHDSFMQSKLIQAFFMHAEIYDL